MQFTLFAAFAVGSFATAIEDYKVPPPSECCFTLWAYGGAQGSVGQIYDGQNRIGGGYPPATYCLRGDEIYDFKSRGCILTPPTGQWQCDEGAKGTSGAAVEYGGGITYHGNKQFYACPVNDHGEWNIYNLDNANAGKCVPITLDTHGKCAAGPPPPPPPPPPSPPSCYSCPKCKHCPPVVPWHPKPYPPPHCNECPKDKPCHKDGCHVHFNVTKVEVDAAYECLKCDWEKEHEQHQCHQKCPKPGFSYPKPQSGERL